MKIHIYPLKQIVLIFLLAIPLTVQALGDKDFTNETPTLAEQGDAKSQYIMAIHLIQSGFYDYYAFANSRTPPTITLAQYNERIEGKALVSKDSHIDSPSHNKKLLLLQIRFNI